MNSETAQSRIGDAFAGLGTIVLGDEPLPAILERVVRLASEVIPGRIEASITLLSPEGPTTVAFSGPPALTLDERQYESERGPCLDAASAGQRIVIPDMRSETRWPQYAEAAVVEGVLSSLSVPLPVQRDVTGAINFYATKPDAFSEQSITLAETFAGHAAVAVANARLFEATAALADQMKNAMAMRAVIEQAKGIVMRDRGCSADDAFNALVRLSQESHVKLRDVAQRLVDQVTGDDVH
jgi:GAF domain-containing protein